MDDIVVTDELGGPQFRKPCDIAFRIMQRRWGVPFAQMAYVGDNPAKDFHAPRQLGMASVWLKGDGLYAGVAEGSGALESGSHSSVSSVKSKNGLANKVALVSVFVAVASCIASIICLQVMCSQLDETKRQTELTRLSNAPDLLLASAEKDEYYQVYHYVFDNVGGSVRDGDIQLDDIVFLYVPSLKEDGSFRIWYWMISGRYDIDGPMSNGGRWSYVAEEKAGDLNLSRVMLFAQQRLSEGALLLAYTHVHASFYDAEGHFAVQDLYIHDGQPGYDEAYRNLLHNGIPASEARSASSWTDEELIESIVAAAG